MPNWAWGTIEVTGRKDAVLAFSRRFIMDDEPVTIDGTRYFARTFTNETREYIEGMILKEFKGHKADEEITCEISADFAWSAYSCVLDGYPQEAPEICITLPESCVRDSVDVTIVTKEPGISFAERITCDRRGKVHSECKDLIPMRCKNCGSIESMSPYEDPEDMCCDNCGEMDFESMQEGEKNA